MLGTWLYSKLTFLFVHSIFEFYAMSLITFKNIYTLIQLT